MVLKDLYEVNGCYSYLIGFNKNGIYVLVIGVVIFVLGLLIFGLCFLWDNVWIFGLFIFIIVYMYFMRGDKSILVLGEYEEIMLKISEKMIIDS